MFPLSATGEREEMSSGSTPHVPVTVPGDQRWENKEKADKARF